MMCMYMYSSICSQARAAELATNVWRRPGLVAPGRAALREGVMHKLHQKYKGGSGSVCSHIYTPARACT